jgi:hypothetical protein
MAVPSWTYAHDAVTVVSQVRLMCGDCRGTPATGVGFLLSDEEITRLYALAGSNLYATVRLALMCRLSREALAAGVDGVLDTTERPGNIAAAADAWSRVSFPAGALPHASTPQLGDEGTDGTAPW